MKFIKKNIDKDNGKATKITYSSSSGGDDSSGSGGMATSITPRSLWGQLYDGTKDISGDMNDVGKITLTNSNSDGDTISNTIQTVEDSLYGDKILVDTDCLEITQDLDVGATATIDEELYVKASTTTPLLFSDNITNSDTITTKNLKVTGQAHFFELVIDKIKSCGGALIATPADGFTIDKVDQLDGSYKLYWQCQDSDGNQRDNMWKVNDQALCMSFNQAKVGTTHDVSNKYYWALVIGVSNNENPTIIDNVAYNWILIAATDADGTVNPEVGDDIVQLGYRGVDDTARQSAIYISAYQSLDSGLTAPLMAQYRGINDFNLAKHRSSYFDATGSKFVGNFEVSGQSIEDYVSGKIGEVSSQAPYIGDDSYWYVYDKDTTSYKKTNYKAEGSNGKSPYIGADGYWYMWDGTSWQKTGSVAEGKDGTTITAYSITYAISTDGTQPSDDKFTYTDYPALSSYYIWSKVEVAYSDGTTTKSYGCSHNGKDGTNGSNGKNGSDGKSASFITLSSGETSYLKIFSGLVTKTYNITSQGITFFAINRTTLDIAEQTTYDTFGDSSLCASLVSKMNSYDNTYFIALISYNGCSVSADLANMMMKCGATYMESWDASKTYLCFLGIKNIGQEHGYVTWNTTEQTLSTYISDGWYYTNSGVLFYIDQNNKTLSSHITDVEKNATSLIEQTADSIMTKVGETYVKVGDGNITLNGDTEINGKLTLNVDTQGFIMYGENGVTEISPQAIGTYDDFISSTTNTIKSNSTAKVTATYDTSGKVTATWTTTQFLGKSFTNGDIILFGDFSQNLYADEKQTTKLSNATAKLSVYENGLLQTTITIGSVGSKTDIGSYTCKGTGSLNVNMTLTGTWDSSEFSPTSSTSTIPKEQPTIYSNISWTNTIPLDKNYTLVGTEGIGCILGNNNVYIGHDGLIANYGGNTFKINTNGIIVQKPSNFKVVSLGTTSYTIEDYIDRVLILTSNATIYLPKSPYTGQTIDLMPKYAGGIKVNPNGNKICWLGEKYQDATTATRTMTALNTYRFICYNNTWITEYLAS